MKKEKTSKRILDAAERELIINHGVLEMSAVAKQADVSIGLAYHHFGSKTGLIAALVDRFYMPIRKIAMGDEIPLELNWKIREKARTAALINYYYSHPLAPLITGRLAREPEVQDIEKAHLNALLAMGARNLIQGQKAGIVNSTLCAPTTIAMLMGGLSLAIQQAVQSTDRPNQDELLNQLWLFVEKALFSNEYDINQ